MRFHAHSPRRQAVKKHAKELEDDGVIFGIMHGILGKTPGMPAPGAKPVLKALRPGLPVLKKEVKGEPGMVACLNGFEHWMLCGGGTKRVEAMGAAAPKCMIIMYEADILDEDLCVKWWEERCAANTALKDGADAGMDNADRLTKEVGTAPALVSVNPAGGVPFTRSAALRVTACAALHARGMSCPCGRGRRKRLPTPARIRRSSRSWQCVAPRHAALPCTLRRGTALRPAKIPYFRPRYQAAACVQCVCPSVGSEPACSIVLSA